MSVSKSFIVLLNCSFFLMGFLPPAGTLTPSHGPRARRDALPLVEARPAGFKTPQT